MKREKNISDNKIFNSFKRITFKELITFNSRLKLINPSLRKFFLICIDVLCLHFVFNLFLISTKENLFLETGSFTNFISILMIFVGIILFIFTGQYKSLSRYIGSKTLYKMVLRNIVIFFLFIFIGNLLNISLPNFKKVLISLFLLSFLNISWRLILRDILIFLKNLKNKNVPKVAIYGAGEAGAWLENSLRNSGNYDVVIFLDDCVELSKRNLNGIPIKNPNYLKEIKDQIDLVLLAIPSINSKELKNIIKNVTTLKLPILEVPSIEDLVSGRAKIDALKPIKIERLLGRKSVVIDLNILEKSISGKTICITGAGGSIGSELCREILNLNPEKLILIEISEPSLYQINKELNDIKHNTEIIPVLCNCCDYGSLKKIFTEYQINIIFHAAAYKHVPLVERNPIIGLSNNVFSTRILCKLSSQFNIEKFILISTDKAVRPTNVMGASKRLSELIVQAHADEQALDNNEKIFTKFSIVRFGNVLGSSGSVIPLFKDQIAAGGPVTVTHPDVIRYFMTINEASQLVLHSSALSKGGDVFLLDMGEPVKIKELAEQMIQLSGLKVRNKSNLNGDIEISYTGLRHGEKLYEELLIDGEVMPTLNNSIFRVEEKFIPSDLLWEKLDILEQSVNTSNKKKSLKALSDLVPEWTMSNLTLSQLN